MSNDRLAVLTERIERAGGDADLLGALFAELQADVGSTEAGRLWWAAFSATDASAT